MINRLKRRFLGRTLSVSGYYGNCPQRSPGGGQGGCHFR
jgi:hypothetical protein